MLELEGCNLKQYIPGINVTGSGGVDGAFRLGKPLLECWYPPAAFTHEPTHFIEDNVGRMRKYGLGDGFTFIAPYFTRVETTLWIWITKAAAYYEFAEFRQSGDTE